MIFFFLASLLTLRLPSIKLKILRQLVELQLTHSAEIKGIIDHAWGIQHNKHKKTQTQLPSLDSSDPKSKDNLVFLPIGQDSSRKRYWASDGPCAFLLGCFHFPIYGYLPGNCYLLDILLPRWRLTAPTLYRLTSVVLVDKSLEGHVIIPGHNQH